MRYPNGCGKCQLCMKTIVQCGADCQVETELAPSPFVANLLKMFPAKCKFTDNGCQVFIILSNMEVHEVDCVYRNTNCPFLDCDDKNVSFIGLGEHLEAKHEDLRKIDQARSKDFIPVSPLGCPFIRHIFFIRIMNNFGLLFEYSNINFT
jgi:hypothetical protein